MYYSLHLNFVIIIVTETSMMVSSGPGMSPSSCVGGTSDADTEHVLGENENTCRTACQLEITCPTCGTVIDIDIEGMFVIAICAEPQKQFSYFSVLTYNNLYIL